MGVSPTVRLLMTKYVKKIIIKESLTKREERIKYGKKNFKKGKNKCYEEISGVSEKNKII